MSISVGFNPQFAAQKNYGVRNSGKQVGFQGNLGTVCSEAGSAIGRQVKLDSHFQSACTQLVGSRHDASNSSKLLKIFREGATVVRDTLAPEVISGDIQTGNKVRAITVQKGEGLWNWLFNRCTIKAEHVDVIQ